MAIWRSILLFDVYLKAHLAATFHLASKDSTWPRLSGGTNDFTIARRCVEWASQIRYFTSIDKSSLSLSLSIYLHIYIYIHVWYVCMCVCVSIANKVLYWSPLFQTNFQDDFPVRCIVHHVLPPRHWDHAVCWQQQHALQLLVRSLRQALVPRLGRWPHDVEELLMIHSYHAIFRLYSMTKGKQGWANSRCQGLSRCFKTIRLFGIGSFHLPRWFTRG